MKVSTDEDGIVCQGLFSKKRYPWARMTKVMLAFQGRRFVHDGDGVRREAVRTALVSLKGRWGRVTLGSRDSTVFKEQLKMVVKRARELEVPIRIEMLAGSLEEWFEYLFNE